MNTYTRPSGQVDHVLQPVSRVVKPITQLYGVNGKKGVVEYMYITSPFSKLFLPAALA